MKPNLFSRLVALALVPCLLQQPVLAAVIGDPWYAVRRDAVAIADHRSLITDHCFGSEALIGHLRTARFAGDAALWGETGMVCREAAAYRVQEPSPPIQHFSQSDRQSWMEEAESRVFDVFVIGGGAAGNSAAAHTSEIGLSTILVEKGDLAMGASSNNTSLAHAGIRYLKKFRDWLYVLRESAERRRLGNLAPHWVRPHRFLFPVYEDSPDPLWKVFLGTMIYEVMARLTGTRNTPWSRYVPRRELEQIRGLKRAGLKGGMEYFMDGRLSDTRYTVGFAQRAAENGASILPRVEALAFEENPDGTIHVTCLDLLTQKTFKIRTRQIVNAGGAWIDEINSKASIQESTIIPRRGIHLIVDRLADTSQIFSIENDRVFFVLPYGDKHSLIGTTDELEQRPPDEAITPESDVKELMGFASRFFPKATPGIFRHYWGIRPLANKGDNSTQASRDHKIIRKKPWLWVLAGVKLTAARAAGEEMAQELWSSIGGSSAKPSIDLRTLPGGDIGNYDQYLKKMIEEHKRHYRPDVIEYLVQNYGSRLSQVLEIAGSRSEYNTLVLTDRPWLMAEVLYAARYDMVLHLSDFLIRRTRWAYQRDLPPQTVEAIARILASELHWDESRIQREIQDFNAELDTHRWPLPTTQGVRTESGNFEFSAGTMNQFSSWRDQLVTRIHDAAIWNHFPGLCGELIDHLLQNAYDALVIRSVYLSEEGYRPKLHVSGSISSEGTLRLTVEDSGIGIERKGMLTIFQDLYSTKRNPFLGGIRAKEGFFGNNGGALLGVAQMIDSFVTQNQVSRAQVIVESKGELGAANLKTIHWQDGHSSTQMAASHRTEQGTSVVLELQLPVNRGPWHGEAFLSSDWPESVGGEQPLLKRWERYAGMAAGAIGGGVVARQYLVSSVGIGWSMAQIGLWTLAWAVAGWFLSDWISARGHERGHLEPVQQIPGLKEAHYGKFNGGYGLFQKDGTPLTREFLGDRADRVFLAGPLRSLEMGLCAVLGLSMLGIVASGWLEWEVVGPPGPPIFRYLLISAFSSAFAAIASSSTIYLWADSFILIRSAWRAIVATPKNQRTALMWGVAAVLGLGCVEISYAVDRLPSVLRLTFDLDLQGPLGAAFFSLAALGSLKLFSRLAASERSVFAPPIPAGLQEGLAIMGADSPIVQAKVDPRLHYLADQMDPAKNGELMHPDQWNIDQAAWETYLQSKYLKDLRRHISAVIAFARYLLADPSLKGKKLVFLGRGSDLIYDAAQALVSLDPAFADRKDDLILIDWSPKYSQFPRVEQAQNFLQEVGSLEGKQGIVLIDEIAVYPWDILDYTLILQQILQQAHFPLAIERRLMSVLDPGNHAYDMALVYHNMAGSLPSAEIIAGANWLADDYDSGREYTVESEGGRQVTRYTYKPNYSLIRLHSKTLIANVVKMTLSPAPPPASGSTGINPDFLVMIIAATATVALHFLWPFETKGMEWAAMVPLAFLPSVRGKRLPTLATLMAELSARWKKPDSRGRASQLRNLARWLRRATADAQDDLDSDIDEAIAQANDLNLSSSLVTVGDKSFPLKFLGNRRVGGRYIRIGSTALIDRTLVLPSGFKGSDRSRLIQVDSEQLEYGPYLIPIVALVVAQDWKDQFIEDDGSGKGLFMSLPLQLGASFVEGIDFDMSDLQHARTFLISLGFKGRLVRGFEPPRPDENFILREADLLEQESRAPAGSSEQHDDVRWRIANMGFIHRRAQMALIDRTLTEKGPRRVIFGGFMTDEGRHYSVAEAIRPFARAGWKITVAQHLNFTAFMAERPKPKKRGVLPELLGILVVISAMLALHFLSPAGLNGMVWAASAPLMLLPRVSLEIGLTRDENKIWRNGIRAALQLHSPLDLQRAGLEIDQLNKDLRNDLSVSPAEADRLLRCLVALQVQSQTSEDATVDRKLNKFECDLLRWTLVLVAMHRNMKQLSKFDSAPTNRTLYKTYFGLWKTRRSTHGEILETLRLLIQELPTVIPTADVSPSDTVPPVPEDSLPDVQDLLNLQRAYEFVVAPLPVDLIAHRAVQYAASPVQLLQALAEQIGRLIKSRKLLEDRISTTMAKNVPVYRAARGLSPRDLASLLKIHRSNVQRVENAKLVPSRQLQQRYASILGVQMEQLVPERPADVQMDREENLKRAIATGQRLFGHILSMTVNSYRQSLRKLTQRAGRSYALIKDVAAGRKLAGQETMMKIARAVNANIRKRQWIPDDVSLSSAQERIRELMLDGESPQVDLEAALMVSRQYASRTFRKMTRRRRGSLMHLSAVTGIPFETLRDLRYPKRNLSAGGFDVKYVAPLAPALHVREEQLWTPASDLVLVRFTAQDSPLPKPAAILRTRIDQRVRGAT